MQWETVAIPFAQGIKPTSHGRVLEQTKLLTAQNCFFLEDEGPRKRYGHDVKQLRADSSVVPLNGIELPIALENVRTPHSIDDPGLSSAWLHGYGIFDETHNAIPGQFTTSTQPLLGYTFGSLIRDNEAAFWDGFRLVSATPGTEPMALSSGQAVIPSLRGAPIAKSLNGQMTPDAADNGVLRTVVWVYSNGSTQEVRRSVYSVASGACLISEEAFSGLTAPDYARVVTAGAWTHVVIQDDETELFVKSWHNDAPSTIISRTLGAVTETSFDVKKFSESRIVVAKIDSSDVVISLLNQNGALATVYTVDLGVVSDAKRVAIDTHPDGILGVLVQNSNLDNKLRTYILESGVDFSGLYDVSTSTLGGRITLSSNYLKSSGYYCWTLFIDDGSLSNSYRNVKAYSAVTKPATVLGDIVLQTTRYNATLTSHAFRVGQRAYVWCAGTPTIYSIQPTWFLCDEKLLPVGKALFGLAYLDDTASVFEMPGVNWHTNSELHPAKDRFVFVGALSYRQRANTASTAPDPNGVWSEPSVFFYSVDFLAPLQMTQAGRSAYIAGAQLWEYDGSAIVEAGFHLAPETYSITDGGAGNLNETKQYNWRIDLCYKNAQNEEVRSWSKVISVAAGAFGAATFKATLTIPHMPMTRRDNAYFLVYRTEGDGTEYYLVSSRNPADASLSANGFLTNDRSSATYTFTDDIADTALIAREYHPANATGYLQPLPAPAAEIISAGRDRIWLAGGELAAGEIAPSRYFLPGEAPSFSPALNIQVDRNAEPITAIGFVGEQAVFFRRRSTYTLDSEGPDNLAQGVWGAPRLALADVGAISQASLALAGEGLYFQSPAGMRVITQGGGLRPPGAGLIGGLGTDIDTLTAEGEYVAAVVVPKYSQIRWYSGNSDKPSVVVDYTKNVWTTFTGLTCVGAAFWLPQDTVVLARGDGFMWTENPDKFLDGDRTYETTIKTAWLHAGTMGDFQRIRRWALFGDADTGLSLRYRIFYDERPFHNFEGFIEFNGNTNDSTWGDNEWGDGSWGDSNNPNGQSGLWFRDNVFRLRRRFPRQKCAVFSIEFSDQGGTAEFSPTVLAIELGRKTGLDRI